MENSDSQLTRRLLGTASFMMALFARDLFAQTVGESSDNPQTAAAAPPHNEELNVRLTVNGEVHDLTLDPRTSLLDALRDHLGLTGTKKGCDHGQCGACTVLVNGVRLNACMSLAAQRDGDAIVTIEGLAKGEKLRAVQAAFVRHDAFQCGYCTPGQIMSTLGMLEEIKRGLPSAASADLMAQPALAVEEIRERMSGNICRCAAYPNIAAAILSAAEAAPR
jgi:xanthine dehydrogenase YagT iron-sulfur-binding subunit